MGVVVQEMVDCEAAGVLFTVNPVDGDPGKMLITANFGLGESVVSGHVEPDTICLKRTSAGLLSVVERQIGSKLLKVVLTEDGTREEDASADQAASVCLSDDVALQLGKLGLYLEKVCGGPRDIEFGLRQNRLYLLQVKLLLLLPSLLSFYWAHYESSIILYIMLLSG